jgi:hypothetical protein
MNNSKTGGNVVPLFRTFEELSRDEQAITKQYLAAWNAAYAKYDETQAVLRKGDSGLADLVMLVDELKDAVEKRNRSLFGIGEVAKRTLRFASVARRPHYGAAAKVLAMVKK